MTFRKTVQALAASILCCGLLASAASAATELKHWPKEARAKIEAMIRASLKPLEWFPRSTAQTPC